jgi:hypothetical protein
MGVTKYGVKIRVSSLSQQEIRRCALWRKASGSIDPKQAIPDTSLDSGSEIASVLVRSLVKGKPRATTPGSLL